MIGVSIQPVGTAATLDANRAASLAGQKAAYLARTSAAGGDGLVRGFVDLTPMWPDVRMSGQRGAYVNDTDTIHLHSRGAQVVVGNCVAAERNFTVSQAQVNAMLAAA